MLAMPSTGQHTRKPGRETCAATEPLRFPIARHFSDSSQLLSAFAHSDAVVVRRCRPRRLTESPSLITP